MNPEIKAAIERRANDYIIEEFPNALEVPHTLTFKRGAEYGYKLAEAKLEIAVKALKEIEEFYVSEQGLMGGRAQEIAEYTLKKLGE